MLAFVLKNRAYLIILMALIIIARSIYKLFHGIININNPSPDGFDKDYIQSVWIVKIVFIVIGVLILLFGIRMLRRR
jgi:hypothetical protein